MKMLGAVIGFALLWCLNQCYATPKYFIAAPNLLRVGVEETVSISVFKFDNEVDIQLSLQDYPNRKKTFSQISGKFRKQQPGLLKIKVNAKDLPDKKSLDKQYVYLKASSNTAGFLFNTEIKILVSYRNAMVFIQTDKPIYNPGQSVNLRVVPLSLDLKPSMNNFTIEVLNPQGIRVERWRNLNTKEGFFSDRLDLSENVILGMWTISALYGHGLVQNASIQFEVREYILPTYSVKIEGPPYILESDRSISIKITSKYTYGKSVLGQARVSLAVLDDAGKTERFSTSSHQLNKGVADISVSTDLLKKHPKIAWFPDGKRLFIEAKVTEQATGQQEEALDNSIYFTSSPLRISFKRTPKFFKPGLPFEIKVDVTHMNGKPAEKIGLEIDAKTDTGTAVQERLHGKKANTDTTDHLGHGSFVVDVPKTFTIKHLEIKVIAKVKHEGKDILSEGVFQPKIYHSPGNNYLFVRVPKSKVDESVDAEVFFVNAGATTPSSLTYMVVAHGKVISQGTIVRNLGVVTSIRFRVTSAMSPLARFVAYCHVNNELVADSAIMEVEEQLPNQVKFLGDQHPQKLPGDIHTIEVQGDPHSRIGILAVDQSVYLLRNDKHLTSDEVFKRMKSHDLGCGAGAGRDNKDVLSRGGLAVMTTINNLKTDARPEYSCAADAKRKRRSAGVVNTNCCKYGEIADPGTCLARAKKFSTSNISLAFHPREDCVVAFYKCCKRKFEKNVRGRAGDVAVPNNLFDDMGLDIDEEILRLTLEDTQVRTHFPETWLYEDKSAGKDGKVSFDVTIPHTITTWIMQAVAVSSTTGFGLTPPFNLRVFKDFFVSLKLPYSAQRGEQVSVIATVFNYQPIPSQVSIYLFRKRDSTFCTYSETGSGTAIYKVKVDGNGATSVAFPIVPTELGDASIEVRVISRTGDADGERRKLKVLPEGKERHESHSVVLDPLDVLRDPTAAKPVKPTTPSKIITSTKGKGIQKNKLSLKLPDSTVPGSEYALLTVIGNLIGPAVSNIIQGQGLNSLIRQPTGCGEQTMIGLAPNVFVLQYLRSTKQVTPQIEATAFNFIRSGYQHELNYRRSDNSFSAWGNTRPGSTWLTAFVIKTFCAIQNLDGVEIDQNVINTAIAWLSSLQRADGVIPERHPVIHQEMDGDINSDITMTAYVVTAFLECKSLSANAVQTMKNAVAYLENMQPNVGRTYVKAVIAYALALASSPSRFKANQDLLAAARYDAGKNTRYWHDGQGGNAVDVETTSYALLTQMALKRRGSAGPIVVWLTEQRKGGGGFVSTQDTCVALQALAAYSEATGGDQLNLRIQITTDRDYKKILVVDQKNALVQQQLDLTNQIGDELFIETSGSGVAQLQVETQYNTPPSEHEVCQFDLSVTTIERVKKQHDQPIIVAPKPKKVKKDDKKDNKKDKRRCKGKGKKKCKRKRKCKKGRRCNKRGGGRKKNPKPTTPAPVVSTRPPPNDGPAPNSVSIKICTKYKKAGKSAGMSIIDVGVLTGFSVKKETLVELRDKVKPGIAKFEISDRHVVLYVDKIPSAHELCFNLELKRDFEVGIIQPVPVTVYDYYEPEDNKCTEYYGPEKNSRLNLATCEHQSCKCALDKCTSCKPSSDAAFVVDQLCKEYDYAFKGKLRSIDEKDKWLRLTFDILDVYRESKTKKIAKATVGQRIKYAKNTNCDCPRFAGKVDSDFLIMGNDQGLQGGSKVVMGEDMFVKEWPNKGPGSGFFKKFLRTLRAKVC